MAYAYDSNILIDILNGVPGGVAASELSDDRYISVITWIEVLAGTPDLQVEEAARTLLSGFRRFELSQDIAEEAVRIRRETRLKLPDAIILATARRLGVKLVTRNTRDFQTHSSDILVPYTL